MGWIGSVHGFKMFDLKFVVEERACLICGDFCGLKICVRACLVVFEA